MLLMGALQARHLRSSRRRVIPKLRSNDIFWIVLPKISRLTVLGWLRDYNYNDAMPTALERGIRHLRPQGYAALSGSTFLKPSALS